ncbi:MAG: hypothetical protein JW751_03970 [Polyangiaceae bacterium]|nr:hypothetical protein [Polyangiaceae bacterium]
MTLPGWARGRFALSVPGLLLCCPTIVACGGTAALGSPSAPAPSVARDAAPERRASAGVEASATAGIEPLQSASDADDPAVSVALMAPGKPPRSRLRHRFTVGAEQRLAVRTTTRLGFVAEAPAMGTEQYVEIRVAALDGAGRATLSVVTSATHPVSLDPAPMGVAQEPSETRALVTSRGLVSFEEKTGSGGVGAWRISDLVEPLPREEVGVGAHWVARRDREEDGAVIEETTAYELVELGADRLLLRLDRQQRPLPRLAPGLAPGGAPPPPAWGSTGEVTVVLGRPCSQGFHQLHGELASPLDGEPIPIDARVDLVPY